MLDTSERGRGSGSNGSSGFVRKFRYGERGFGRVVISEEEETMEQVIPKQD